MARIHAVSYPEPHFYGDFSITNGMADNFLFFKWLSGFFKVPQMRRIRFDHAAMNFFVNKERTDLNDIRFESSVLDLSGFFSLYSNNLVSGDISIDMPYDVLLKSPAFKRLLASLQADAESIAFGFKLSGPSEKMSFQWKRSQFKQSLRKMLPDWIESRIEEQVEQIMVPESNTDN